VRSPDRFMPVRAGIVNLYEYDDQVFELADGRLLLRGHNTSGKTKALELVFPFALDGDISPKKLDPFAKNAKEMKWNLVGCVDHDQRLGYVWLEFARLGAEGLEYVTGGIGMKANKNTEGVQRWYFVIRGRRIGQDLELRRGAYPLTRRELIDELGERDDLAESARAYRQLLNEDVFGFASVEQYETMLTLLRELRRPHLSKELKPDDVAKLLTGALPEVDHDLMRRVGEGLEQLDDLEAALATAESVRDRVEQFLRSSYRSYARAALADRGEQLKAAARDFGKASDTRRAAGDALAVAQSDARRIAEQFALAKTELDTAGGEQRALLQSGEWAEVAEIEQLGRAAGHARAAAEQARERAEDAAARLAASEDDARDAAAAAEGDRVALAETLAALAADADGAGFTRHGALAGELSAATADLLRDEAAALVAVLAEHERLLEALGAASERLECARIECDLARSALQEAGDERAAAEAALASARDALHEAIEAWAAELVELRLDTETLAGTLDREDAGPWQGALAAARDALVTARSEVERESERLEERRAALEQERDAVAAERDADPPRAHTRSGRDTLEGAPFWRLVDFAPSLDAAAQAGLEAALEGAGLLDAWVTPDGSVQSALDVLLDAGSPAVSGPSLTAVLVAEAEVVRPILAAIALVDGLVAEPCAVTLDGRFRLGPAEGRFEKPEAEYIGAAARAARRARRMAELDVALAQLAVDRADAERSGTAVRERLAALAAEAERFPSAQSVAEARQGVALAAAREDDARAALAERDRDAVAAGQRREAAAAQGVSHAAAHRLPELDLPAVRVRTLAAHRYVAGLPAALRAEARSVESTIRQLQVDERLVAAGTAAAELTRAHELAAGEARRVESEHAVREAALGRTGEEIRARMAAVEQRLQHWRAECERLGEANTDAAVKVAERIAAHEGAGQEIERAAAERDAALDRFRRLEASDVFALALDDEAPADLTEAHAWTLTRALEVLRAIAPERLAVRLSLVSLANQVQQRCAELDRGLGQVADMAVVPESDPDGILVVRVRRGASLMTLAEIRRSLDDEINERERALSAEQRRVFGDALLDEIAEHLRSRIERVAALVADMNATLARCETGSGRTVQLEWAPREDEELRTVTRLLRRSVATLGQAEREPLIAFFRSRIQQARELAAPDPATGAIAHLRVAFDYRDWFGFSLYEVQGGQRVKLTAKRHAVGSGGEQAVLVHMPLLASAAALYASSRDGRAPRLVILDEALSGIDDQTRERVFGVLVALDLDVVMTSHELWGTYRSVPSLSIYQLHRENGVFGVASEHFLWDGKTLRELEQAQLLP
jgi:uncharacterized protein (TIGR02680 family)